MMYVYDSLPPFQSFREQIYGLKVSGDRLDPDTTAVLTGMHHVGRKSACSNGGKGAE